MRRPLPLLAAAMILTSLPAQAEPQRITVANGLVSFSVPDGWVRSEDPKVAAVVEPDDTTDELHVVMFCRVYVQSQPWGPTTTQENINARVAARTIKEQGPSVTTFSNSQMVDGVRAIDMTAAPDNALEIQSRSFLIVGDRSVTQVAFACTGLRPEARAGSAPKEFLQKLEAAKAKDAKKIAELFASIRIHRP